MSNEKQNQFVNVVTRFGQVIGVYQNSQDAFQIINDLTAKGQTAELTIKPLL